MSQDQNDEIPLQPLDFDVDMIKKYPRSNRRLTINVSPYSLLEKKEEPEGTTTHISPYGIQFRCEEAYPEGTLLKVQLSIPDYWNRKQQFVEYRRIDQPDSCKILVRVVQSESVGRRGKKSIVTCRTVNIDEIDEQVLKAFLQE